MKIYTKTGDKGETSLFGGKRVKKNNSRINAYGTSDELLSWVGLIRDQNINKRHKEMLIEIQDRLFTIGAELAADPDKPKLKKPDLFERDIELLEKEMDKMNENLPEMTHFILPGGNTIVSYCHIARTVCRRCERLVITLNEEEPINEMIIRYFNRLSDYLFVLSRTVSKQVGAEEIPWKPRN